MILTNNFTNDSRVLKEGATLVNAGYSVKLVCFGNDALPVEDTASGMKVRRIFFPKGKRTFLQTIRELLHFLKFCCIVCLKEGDVDIIHCHDLYPLPLGVIIKALSFGKKKIVYDTHEYQTEVGLHVKGIVKKIYELTERFFIRYADIVITVSDSIADEYKRLYNIPKPHLVLNCPPYRDTVPPKDLFRHKFSIPEGSLVFLYQGGLSAFRGIERTLEAFKNINTNDRVLVVMGYGPLEPLVKEYAYDCPDRIFFHPSVTPAELLNYTASADVGILCYENVCLNHYYCSPNKLFEYIMADIPVIASDLYEIGRIFQLYGNGIIVEDGVEDLRRAIESLGGDDIVRMKDSIAKMKKIYSWEEQEKKLLKAYKELERAA